MKSKEDEEKMSSRRSFLKRSSSTIFLLGMPFSTTWSKPSAIHLGSVDKTRSTTLIPDKDLSSLETVVTTTAKSFGTTTTTTVTSTTTTTTTVEPQPTTTLPCPCETTGSKTFNGNSDSQWTNGDNWTPSGIPDRCDDVVIPAGKTVDLTENVECHTIDVQSGAELNTNGNIVVEIGRC